MVRYDKTPSSYPAADTRIPLHDFKAGQPFPYHNIFNFKPWIAPKGQQNIY